MTRDSSNQDGLFRKEVVRGRSARLQGEVLLPQPLSLQIVVALGLVLLLGLSLLAIFGRYPRVERAEGILFPKSGITRLSSPRDGVVTSVAVKVGEDVVKDQLLICIESRRFDGSGDPLDDKLIGAVQQQISDTRAEQQITLQDEANARDQLLNEVSLIEQSQKEMLRERDIRARRAALAEEKLMRMRKGADAALVSKNQLIDIEDQTLSLQESALVAERADEQINTKLRELRLKLKQLSFTYAAKRSVLEAKDKTLQQQLFHEQFDKSIVINAPRAGRVAAISVLPGQQITSRDPLLAIVDPGAKLEAQLKVSAAAIGLLHRGQSVRLHLDGFPYQKFGYIYGTIHEISAVSQSGKELVFLDRENESGFGVSVELSRQEIEADGISHVLPAGMHAVADITVDRPRLFQTLWGTN